MPAPKYARDLLPLEGSAKNFQTLFDSVMMEFDGDESCGYHVVRRGGSVFLTYLYCPDVSKFNDMNVFKIKQTAQSIFQKPAAEAGRIFVDVNASVTEGESCLEFYFK